MGSSIPLKTMKNMRLIATFIFTVALVGCRTSYPEINGTYIEDKTTTIAYARKNGSIKSDAIKTYANDPCMMIVIDGNVLSKQWQDQESRFDHHVRFDRIDPSTFRFRYPYDLESDAFVILEDDGIWLTVPGKPDNRFKFKKQE
jgi:hypothetical protein